GIDVVQEDEIEVGRVAQLLAAQLSVTDDGEARDGSVRADLRPASRKRRVEDDVGERGQMIGEPLDGERATQILRQQTQRLRLLKMTQRIHLPFGVVAVRRQDARQLVAPSLP